MGYVIEQQPIGATAFNSQLSGVRYIIAHETYNDSSTIQNEIDYMKRNKESAFVTDFVGNGRIIQIAEHGKVSWGAGPNANSYAWAQVEWVRAHNQTDFNASYRQYVWYLRYLADKAGLPKRLNQGAGIVTHSWVTNNLGGTDHMDPDAYLAKWGVSMAQFSHDIQYGISGSDDFPHAALSEDIATIVHPKNWAVQAWNKNGKAIKGKFYDSGTSWKVNNVITVDDKSLLNIGTNIYIDRQYTNIDDSVITINYTPGYSVSVWDDQWNGTGKKLKTGTSWKTHGRRWSDSQHDWMFNVGTNQWVRKQYTQFGNGI